MGNCLFGGLGEEPRGTIKVITSNGGIMEFDPPITVGCIADEFPGHGLFRTHDLFWKPLPHHEDLVAGKSYYLLPRNSRSEIGGQTVREGHVRSNSVPDSAIAPYRMSFDYQGVLRRSQTEVFSRCGDNNGVWKVKLIISPKRLTEILEEEGHTQELIESVRTVAKCGSGGYSSMGLSDHWSLSSSGSQSGSSKTDGLREI